MKKIFCLFFAIMLVFSCAACGKSGGDKNIIGQGLTEFEFTNASIVSTDKFGTRQDVVGYKKSDVERYTGLFYWLWLSNTNYYYHDIYDVTKLMSTPEGEEAFWNINTNDYDKQQLSRVGAFHFTNEPMFGYYNSSDPWVITRQMEMFMWAGIDYIFLDTSNYLIYDQDYSNAGHFDGTIKSPCYTLLDTMLGLYNQGWNIPKVVFLTNSYSGERVEQIYNAYYKSGKYESLWFAPEGKPMIIGTTDLNGGASDAESRGEFDAIDATYLAYFDVKETQWPNQAKREHGFPWISNNFYARYHTESMAISVSVAQHGNVGFTDMHKRSHRGYNAVDEVIEENWQQGANFEKQWELVYDIESAGNQVKFVQVTGWNEWIGAKFGTLGSKAVMVDNFYGEYTRDIEPDKTLYQDTTYLQLIRNNRKYKYAEPITTYSWPQKTINKISDFDGVPATYVDPQGDAIARDYHSFDVRRSGLYYTDNTNRNDIVEVKVAHDKTNLYMLVSTKEDMVIDTTKDNNMNILIKTKNNQASNFEGYNYIINRSILDTQTSIESCTGGWNWQNAGSGNIVIEGNQMFVTIPLSALGMSYKNVNFEFKVADNVVKPSWYTESDSEHGILNYYLTGDSAPIGRLNYAYGY